MKNLDINSLKRVLAPTDDTCHAIADLIAIPVPSLIALADATRYFPEGEGLWYSYHKPMQPMGAMIVVKGEWNYNEWKKKLYEVREYDLKSTVVEVWNDERMKPTE